MAVDTLGHLLALHVTADNEHERAQAGVLVQTVQAATGQSVQLAWVNQGYCGVPAAPAAAEAGIRLEVVKLALAKRGFVLLPRRWVVGTHVWLDRALLAVGARLRAVVGHLRGLALERTRRPAAWPVTLPILRQFLTGFGLCR